MSSDNTNNKQSWKDIPASKLKVYACFCPSEQALSIWYTSKILTASLDKITRDKIISYDNDTRDNVVVVIRRFDYIIGYARIASSSSDKDDIPITWNRLICLSDRKAVNILIGKKDGQEITEAKKAEKLLMMLDEAPEIESLDILKEKIATGDPDDDSEMVSDDYNEMKRPRCDFDITNMTYEEYLVEFANQVQNFHRGGRGYLGRNFDPNYRGGRGRGRGR